MNYKAILLGLLSFAIAFMIFQALCARNHQVIIRKPSLKYPEHNDPAQVPYYDQKKVLAQKLAVIYLDLENAVRYSKPPTPKTLLELSGIISELDPAHKLSTERREQTDPKPTNSSVILDVCPEKYMGETYRYPYYQEGWVLQDCKNVKPLDKVVSIAVNTMAYPKDMEKQVDTVLQGINRTYPQLTVFLAAKTSEIEKSAKKYPNVKAISASKGSSLGTVWNQLISEVSTPYTLVARDVVHFTWVARIERQIRMISTTEHVGIAGGSFRNLTGHWRVGCRQTKLFNYVLQYEEGYHHSRDSCMFCDDLEGPFVAKTSLLKTLKFSEKYDKEIIFEDFFLRVFRTGNLILNCPDVMYYTTDYSSEVKLSNKESWRPLARDITVIRVVLVDYDIRHKFSCSDISYKCDPLVSTKYVALPKCCLVQFEHAMNVFHQLSVANNLFYETDSGSTVACLKFKNYSPFDIDGDLFLSSYNFSFVRTQASYLKQKGFRIGSFQPPTIVLNGAKKIKSSGFFAYYTPDIRVEVYGITQISGEIFSPPELNKLSHYTKCRLGDIWINCKHFPGLYARNRYGPDLLKHTQSWRIVGNLPHSFARYKPGSFRVCDDPTFHSCLDRFPTDGNIAFKVF